MTTKLLDLPRELVLEIVDFVQSYAILHTCKRLWEPLKLRFVQATLDSGLDTFPDVVFHPNVRFLQLLGSKDAFRDSLDKELPKPSTQLKAFRMVVNEHAWWDESNDISNFGEWLCKQWLQPNLWCLEKLDLGLYRSISDEEFTRHLVPCLSKDKCKLTSLKLDVNATDVSDESIGMLLRSLQHLRTLHITIRNTFECLLTSANSLTSLTTLILIIADEIAPNGMKLLADVGFPPSLRRLQLFLRGKTFGSKEMKWLSTALHKPTGLADVELFFPNCYVEDENDLEALLGGSFRNTLRRLNVKFFFPDKISCVNIPLQALPNQLHQIQVNFHNLHTTQPLNFRVMPALRRLRLQLVNGVMPTITFPPIMQSLHLELLDHIFTNEQFNCLLSAVFKLSSNCTYMKIRPTNKSSCNWTINSDFFTTTLNGTTTTKLRIPKLKMELFCNSIQFGEGVNNILFDTCGLWLDFKGCDNVKVESLFTSEVATLPPFTKVELPRCTDSEFRGIVKVIERLHQGEKRFWLNVIGERENFPEDTKRMLQQLDMFPNLALQVKNPPVWLLDGVCG